MLADAVECGLKVFDDGAPATLESPKDRVLRATLFTDQGMKSFLASFFGTLFAMFLLAGCALLLVLGFVALASLGGKGPKVQRHSLLVLDLSIPITDAPPQFDLSRLFPEALADQGEQQVPLRDVVRAIDRAGQDSRIDGILITGNLLPIGGTASGYPSLKEIRQALVEFKESKKPVFAYLQLPIARAYYLASIADEIYVDPQAQFALMGPATFPLFFAEALQKFGIGAQVVKVGKYKSAVDPFLRENMSPEDREQLQKLFGDLWQEITATIESSRKFPAGSLERLINENGLIDAQQAIKAGLGTAIMSHSQLIDQLKSKYGVDKKNNTFRQVSIPTYVQSFDQTSTGKSDSGSKIGVVYAEGDIVDGEGGPGSVGGDRYAREIRKMRFDPNVKAIVLRVNSPGGSVFAAEMIYQELKAASAVKPVVASFGTYAASGGYYIAAATNRIFTEPTTITGSIGIFGLLFNFEKLASNNGIKTDSVTTTTPLTSLFDPFIRKSDTDIAILQKSVDRDYEMFLEHVAESRQMTVEQVNQVAQGRVWSGLDAQRVKLADELGGLEAAVTYAAKVTSLGDHPRIVEYPARKDLGKKLEEIFQAAPRPPVSRLDPINESLKQLERQLKDFRSLNDPQNIYALFPAQIQWN